MRIFVWPAVRIWPMITSDTSFGAGVTLIVPVVAGAGAAAVGVAGVSSIAAGSITEFVSHPTNAKMLTADTNSNARTVHVFIGVLPPPVRFPCDNSVPQFNL